MTSLTLPMAFGMDIRRRVMVPMPPDVFAAIEDSPERAALGLKLGPFCARLVRIFFRLEFLSGENIAWLGQVRAHLPGLELLDVINLVIAWMRREVIAGRVVPGFLAGQAQKPEKSAAPGRTRARRAQAVVESQS